MTGRRNKLARLGCNYTRKVEDIPDLLVQILSKLPANSVIRCKLVCMLWLRLIKEPRFAQLQFNCSPKAPMVILFRSRVESDPRSRNKLSLMDIDGNIVKYVSLPPSFIMDYSVQVICSFNGLVFFTKSVGENDLAVYICNPATHEIIEAPAGSPSCMVPSIAVLYEPNRDKYTIFRFFSESFQTEEISYKYEIYTPDDGKWSRVSDIEECPVINIACPFLPTHLCIGGRIFWLVWLDVETPSHILCIDVDGHLTKIMLPANEVMEFNVLTFLADYEGHLAIVCVYHDETCLLAWSLTNHDTSSWDFLGGAELDIDNFLDRVNSIVSVGQELLFIINFGMGPLFTFQFLNLGEMSWRKIESNFLSHKGEPVAFLYEESLFKCGKQESWTLGKGED